MLHVEEEIIDRITEQIYYMLNGKDISPIEHSPAHTNDEIHQVITYFNTFINEFNCISDLISHLAKGDIQHDPCKSNMGLIQDYKQIQSNLRHIGLKTQQIAQGDLNQRMDSFMGNISTAFNSMTDQLQAAFNRIEKQNRELEEANTIIKRERNRSEQLLLNILPKKVAQDLKIFGKTEPKTFHNVTIFFSDIVDFTNHAENIKPTMLINELTNMFTKFDEIMARHNCERIKTIGDAYLGVCGMHPPTADHAAHMMNAAIEIRDYLINTDNRTIDWKVRIGMHSGSVVGGVVGSQKYVYDVFGDAINTASRMESNGIPGEINISENTYLFLKEKFSFTKRETIKVKGKGDMDMYLLN